MKIIVASVDVGRRAKLGDRAPDMKIIVAPVDVGRRAKLGDHQRA